MYAVDRGRDVIGWDVALATGTSSTPGVDYSPCDFRETNKKSKTNINIYIIYIIIEIQHLSFTVIRASYVSRTPASLFPPP